MEELTLQNVFNFFSVISPFISAYIIYHFGIKKKEVELDFDKKRELNIVLADLLDILYYLQYLKRTINIQKEDEILSLLPKSILLRMALNSPNLNEECFSNLEESIKKIKQYDAIIYYETVRIGKDINHIKKTFIIPFMNVKDAKNSGTKIADYLSNNILEELEDSILNIAKELGKITLNKAEAKINLLREYGIKEIKKNLVEELYKYYSNVLPFSKEEKEQFTIDDMFELLESPEIQQLYKSMEMSSLDETINILSDEPNITLEELTEKLKNDKLE